MFTKSSLKDFTGTMFTVSNKYNSLRKVVFKKGTIIEEYSAMLNFDNKNKPCIDWLLRPIEENEYDLFFMTVGDAARDRIDTLARSIGSLNTYSGAYNRN